MNKYGVCCVCGRQGKLSYEHVPPKKAYNSFRSQEFQVLPMLLKRELLKKGKIQQKGVGAYTLCPDCNNTTGSLYAPEYVQWARTLSENIIHYNLSDNRMFGKPKTIEIILRNVFPLRFLKQVITIFCSRNGERFQQAHPDLKDYLLNKDSQNAPDDFSVYMYINTNEVIFNSGITALIENGRSYIFSEFTHYPFGFCLFIGNVLNRQMTDITYFNRYLYDERADIYIGLPVIDRKSPLPADHRTEYEISYDEIQNQFKETQRIAVCLNGDEKNEK